MYVAIVMSRKPKALSCRTSLCPSFSLISFSTPNMVTSLSLQNNLYIKPRQCKTYTVFCIWVCAVRPPNVRWTCTCSQAFGWCATDTLCKPYSNVLSWLSHSCNVRIGKALLYTTERATINKTQVCKELFNFVFINFHFSCAFASCEYVCLAYKEL